MGNDRAATMDILRTTNTTPNTSTQNKSISSVEYSPYRPGSFIQECSAAYGNNRNTSHIGSGGAAPSICSSMNLFEDLFSKADKLIGSGKKRDDVMCDVSKAGPNKNLMKKYSRPEEERLMPKLDSRIDAIIKRYSGGASTILDSPRGGSRYPLCPITTSPMTFTPSFPEGCSGFGSYAATDPLYCSNNNDDANKPTSCATKKNKDGNGKPNTPRGVSVGGARGKSVPGGAESRGKSFAGGRESRPKASSAFQDRSNTKAELRNCHFQGRLEKPEAEAAPNVVAKNRLAAAQGGTINAGENTKASVRGVAGVSPISAACQACAHPSKKSPMNKTTTTATPKTAGGGRGGGGGGRLQSTNKSGNKSSSSANYGGDRTNNGGCPCAQGGGAGGAVGGGGMMPSNQPVFTPDGVANGAAKMSSYEVSTAAEMPPARSDGEGMQGGCCGDVVVIDGTYGSPDHSTPAGKGRRSTKVGKKKAPKPRHLLVAEAKRVYGENQRLRLEGMELRKEMECTRKGLMIECAKVLHSVLSFCEHRSKKEKAEIRAADKDKLCGAPCPQSKKGAGCSSGMCGGYTPSGWNKANALSSVDETCCLPPRTIPPPCPARGGGGESQCPQEGQDAVSSGVVDCNMCPSVRIIGEMVFQLERRILEYVFGVEGKNKRRFYGYTVSNVCYMITKESHAPSGKTDSIGRSDKSSRFEKIMCALQKYGYDVKVHPEFCQNIVNKFGVLACPPDQCTIDSFRLQDPCAMSALISKLCGSPSEVVCLNIILRCLAFLARCDGKPMFVW